MQTKIISVKSPKVAAIITLKHIRKLPGGEYATVRELGENGWQVIWEEGPYEWTIAATGGEDIFAQEYYADGYSGRVATFEFDTSKGVFAEPQNHYALGFYKF